jgi:hypothetical protein
MTGSAERRTTPAALPAVSAAPPLAAVTVPLVAALSRPTDDWAEHLNRLLYLEVRVAVANGMLTVAEAEQMLARLAIVIDQAITTQQT